MSTSSGIGVDGSDGLDSDADLLARHVAGDPTAFTVLIQRHRDRLWAVALRTTQNPDDAADALQDALLSAFRRADTFRGESAVTTWLHRIVVNAALDRMRRAAVRPTVALPTSKEGVILDIPDGADAIGQRENQLVIAQALAELPPD
ncbi:MAG: sigma-70 family RNA polymerase sigma factor, partial [Actinomycetales bacterium]